MGQFIGGSGPFGYARPADSDESFGSMSFQERPPGYLAEIRDSRPDVASNLERMFDTQTQLDELSRFVSTRATRLASISKYFAAEITGPGSESFRPILEVESFLAKGLHVDVTTNRQYQESFADMRSDGLFDQINDPKQLAILRRVSGSDDLSEGVQMLIADLKGLSTCPLKGGRLADQVGLLGVFYRNPVTAEEAAEAIVTAHRNGVEHAPTLCDTHESRLTHGLPTLLDRAKRFLSSSDVIGMEVGLAQQGTELALLCENLFDSSSTERYCRLLLDRLIIAALTVNAINRRNIPGVTASFELEEPHNSQFSSLALERRFFVTNEL
jgi:hypothetical protein